MKVLINCSTLKVGGGIQVGHSFLNEIKHNSKHEYHVVLSKNLKKQLSLTEFPPNFTFYEYTMKPKIIYSIFGINHFLDRLEKEVLPDVVFTVFGPAHWKPNTYHIAGFAKSQHIYINSLYYKTINYKRRISLLFRSIIIYLNYKYYTDEIITENKSVSDILKTKLNREKIHTVTNNYNDVYDKPEKWDRSITLNKFDGVTLFTLSSNYDHKNLNIIPLVVENLKENYPQFSFRFVVTLNENELKNLTYNNIDHLVFLGKININQCPHIYKQVDLMFLPTLVETFSASYPEAMKMRVPILTSDLSFAKEICKNSAIYFDPLDPKDIANKIYKLSQDDKLKHKLKKLGTERLKNFDTSKERSKKYLDILENAANYPRL